VVAIQTTTKPPKRGGRWLLPVGIVCLIAGVALAVVAPETTNLTSLVVTTPTSGMVATAVGNGGSSATHVEAGTNGLAPIKGLGLVPTTPAVFLKPRQLTLNGKPDGTGAAFWKVWWNGPAQTKGTVSLQQSVTTSDAQQGLAELNPSVKGLYPNDSPLTVPGIPGAFGYQWVAADGTGSTAVPFHLWAAMFQRGRDIALVSMQAYGSASLNNATFVAFAQAQYAAMKGAEPSPAFIAGFAVLVLAGIVLLIIAFVRRIRRRRAPSVAMAGAFPAPGAPWPAPSPYGAQPAWPTQPPGSPQQGGYTPPGGISYGLPADPAPFGQPAQPTPYAQPAPHAQPAPYAPPPPASPQAALPPPGWYADPYAQGGSTQSRYWDGAVWTGHVSPNPAGPPDGAAPT
jgi:hypothetical protein